MCNNNSTKKEKPNIVYSFVYKFNVGHVYQNQYCSCNILMIYSIYYWSYGWILFLAVGVSYPHHPTPHSISIFEKFIFRIVWNLIAFLHIHGTQWPCCLFFKYSRVPVTVHIEVMHIVNHGIIHLKWNVICEPTNINACEKRIQSMTVINNEIFTLVNVSVIDCRTAMARMNSFSHFHFFFFIIST